MRLIRLLFRFTPLSLLLLLLLPSAAFASAAIGHSQVLPTPQLWSILIGSLVPLVTYVLNHVGPWVTEPVKAAVLVVVAAIATALYTALATNVFGFNTPTLELVASGVFAALVAHKILWLPSGVSVLLGGGSNRQPQRVAPAQGGGGPGRVAPGEQYPPVR